VLMLAAAAATGPYPLPWAGESPKACHRPKALELGRTPPGMGGMLAGHKDVAPPAVHTIFPVLPD